MDYTKILKLKKPSYDDPVDIKVFNDNFDSIDAMDARVSNLINQGRYYDAYELFKTMKITNPINGELTTIANTNLNIIERALNKINPEEIQDINKDT